MAHLFVDVTDDQRECVITVSGELDIEHAPQLASLAHVAMTSPSWDILVVDLTNVPFLDSTGLGALLDLHAAVIHAGRTVRLRGAQKQVRRVIEITGLTETLLVPTEAQSRVASAATAPTDSYARSQTADGSTGRTSRRQSARNHA